MLSHYKQTHRVNDFNILFLNSTFVIVHNVKITRHYGSIFFNIGGCISEKFPAYV